MRGTEKQIAWANQIIETVVSILTDAKAELENAPEDPRKPAVINSINEKIEAINAAEYAGDIIDLFKNIKRTENIYADYAKLQSCYRVTYPGTTGQRKILCK